MFTSLLQVQSWLTVIECSRIGDAEQILDLLNLLMHWQP